MQDVVPPDTERSAVSVGTVQWTNKVSPGYNRHELPDYHHELTESLAKQGLLRPKPAGDFTTWAKDCIVFPLKNQEGKIISLYGRSTSDQYDQRHFYLAGRVGLYPRYSRSSRCSPHVPLFSTVANGW